MSIKTGQFIKLCKFIYDFFLASLQATEMFSKHSEHLRWGFFAKIFDSFKLFTISAKKLHHRLLVGF